jgi:hypothetical protein
MESPSVPTQRAINLFFAIVFGAVVISIVSGHVLWQAALITGRPVKLPPPGLPVPPLSVHGTAAGDAARDALGADFSQVYYSAQALRHGDSAYAPADPAFRDRFGRRSNYPPLVNWLYQPLARLDYAEALLIHTFGTLLLFVGTTVWVMAGMGLARHLGRVLVLCGLLYFYTTNGFFHLERGQFDLIVASSIALTFALVFAERNRLGHAVVAGLSAAVKYSSLPFLGSLCWLGFLGSQRRNRWAYVVALAIVPLTALVFYRQMHEYLPSLRQYELEAEPRGVTFCHIMPRAVAKSVQVGCMLVFSAWYWFGVPKASRSSVLAGVSLPYALAMAAQGICFGTQSFEYRSVMFLGLIPALYVWVEKSPARAADKILVAVMFAVFLVVALRVFQEIVELTPQTMTWFYLVSSLAFLGVGVRMMVRSRDVPASP